MNKCSYVCSKFATEIIRHTYTSQKYLVSGKIATEEINVITLLLQRFVQISLTSNLFPNLNKLASFSLLCSCNITKSQLIQSKERQLIVFVFQNSMLLIPNFWYKRNIHRLEANHNYKDLDTL